jgi:hypothetical protein
MLRHTPSPWHRSVVFVAATLAVSSCVSGPTISTGTDALPGASTVAVTPPPQIPGGHGCSDLSPTVAGKHGLEVRGVMRDGQPFYGLFAGVRQLTAGKDLTAYLRIPGARASRVTLVGPDGRLARGTGLRPGLPPYPWDRPGDPWLGTLTFSRSGCWRIYVDRAGLDGEMWVRVG